MTKKGELYLKRFLIIISSAFFLSSVFLSATNIKQRHKIAFADGFDFLRDACFTVSVDGELFCYGFPELGITKEGVALKDINGVIERIYYDTLVKEQSAFLEFTPDGGEVFKISKEKNGYSVSKNKLKKEILFALETGKNSVKIKKDKIIPEQTYLKLKKQTQKRSVFSTYYGNSPSERKHNVMLAASAVSGTVLKDGEEFSFNKTVGERCEERGYKCAKIIVDGQFTEGVGGGVCQVSTTLYNAALKAGLIVTECHRHSLAVGYVNVSFDAMVTDGGSDLKFVNRTGENIYIAMQADGENLSAVIYGVKNEYEYRLVSQIKQILKAKTFTVKNTDGAYAVSPKDGLISEGYVYTYKGGELIEKSKIREDYYKPVDGIEISD